MASGDLKARCTGIEMPTGQVPDPVLQSFMSRLPADHFAPEEVQRVVEIVVQANWPIGLLHGNATILQEALREAIVRACSPRCVSGDLL